MVIYQVLSDLKASEPVKMKLVHYLSLIFLLLVASPVLFASVPVSIDTDGDGRGSGTSGLTFGGKEYRWIKERKTQEEAQAYAESLGGHLVVINSADEDDFVYSMVRDASLTGLGIASDGGGVSYVWLGGKDAASEGEWVWVNGEPFQYTNWGQAEPDNYLGQDGLAMGLQNWPDGSSGSAAYGLASEWNDISRSNQLTFIVELSSGGESGGSTGENFSTDFALNYAASLSYNGGCAIDDNGIGCWGNSWIKGSRIPSFSNPKQLAVGTGHACAIDDTGVVCWGYNEDGRADIPDLSNPYFVTIKWENTCVLDDTGVVCWGTNASGQTDVPSLSNPRELAIGVENACALDDNGVVCWGDDSRAVSTNIPETVNPSKLTMGDLHACVTDNDRVVCWGSGFSPSNSSSPTYEQPTLVNPRKLVAGGYHVCALDDHGLKCWGRNNESQLEIPILINPSSVYAAGQFGSCALDDNGLQCWGSEVSDTNSEKERSLKEFPSDLSFASSGQRVVTQYLQTTSASENITTLNVVNTSDRSQTFRGILRNGSGEKVGVDQPVLGTDIPAMGRLTLNSDDLEAIFGIEAWKGPAMLTIKGDSTFDLMSKLESPSGLVSNTNCIRDNRVLNLEGFDSNNMSYVRLINTGAKTTQAIKGTLYDGNGIVVGNANAELVAKLDPYQQTWINRNQLSSLVDAEWNGEGMLEVNATPGLKLLNLNFITDEATFFNFSCADKATLLAEPSSSSGPANIGRIYLQTTSTSQNVSLTHLVNTSDSGQQYTGTLYGSDGAQVGSADQPLHSGTIASKGRLILSSTDIESAFNISPWRGPAILEVKGDGLFELMTKLESPSGLISNTNCVRTGQVHNIGGFDQTDVTYVRFINIGDTPITNIRGSLYDDGGIVVGEANPVLVEELPAKSHVWRNRNQLSDTIGNTWNGTASLKIDNADSNLRLLNLNFINSETFFNFSCYETGQ